MFSKFIAFHNWKETSEVIQFYFLSNTLIPAESQFCSIWQIISITRSSLPSKASHEVLGQVTCYKPPLEFKQSRLNSPSRRLSCSSVTKMNPSNMSRFSRPTKTEMFTLSFLFLMIPTSQILFHSFPIVEENTTFTHSTHKGWHLKQNVVKTNASLTLSSQSLENTL